MGTLIALSWLVAVKLIVEAVKLGADRLKDLSAQATPEQLLEQVRSHWAIENRSHYVRDLTFDEDRSQIRTGHGPRTMAALRNFARSTRATLHALAL